MLPRIQCLQYAESAFKHL